MNIIKECRYGKMMFNTNDLFIGKSLNVYREYSNEEIDLLKRVIKKGYFVVEVGANIGALTIPIAQTVGESGFIIAFEPQRLAYYALCGNVFINNLANVFCFQRVIGSENKMVQVPDFDYSVEGNYGGLELNKQHEHYNKVNKIDVEMIKIDNLNLAECDLIKIDVEGMELDVLNGAKETIIKHQPLLYVEDDRHDKLPKLLNWLKEMDYKVWQHFPRLFNDDNWVKIKENVFGPTVSANLLCCPRDFNIENEIKNTSLLSVI